MQKGFTLFELLITISIATLLALLASTSFTQTLQASKMASQVTLIRGFLIKTREAAITHGKTMKFCGANRHNECVKSDFTKFVIFRDNNKNSNIDSNEFVFAEEFAHIDNPLIFALGTKYNTVTFNSLGTSTRGSIYICPQANSKIRPQRIIISGTGQVRIPPKSAPGAKKASQTCQSI